MPSFLLDTNFCIHFIRGKVWARLALSKVQVPDVAVSAVTVGELYEGAHRSNQTGKEIKKADTFLAPIEVIAFGREEAKEWGLIEANLRKQGKPIEAEDSIIAATAIKRGLILVTGNTKHFDRIEGLKLVDWEKKTPTK
ncbi:MAG: type II toxin-antitoxin system VapC family toxin [Holophaga sp.]|jgi:tRNA(fMet)-specific endonuclease VapC